MIPMIPPHIRLKSTLKSAKVSNLHMLLELLGVEVVAQVEDQVQVEVLVAHLEEWGPS
jgi:hypothetical protein